MKKQCALAIIICIAAVMALMIVLNEKGNSLTLFMADCFHNTAIALFLHQAGQLEGNR